MQICEMRGIIKTSEEVTQVNTGDRIKQRRIELGLTVEELAKKIGKSRATIYRYENGDIENMPTPILEPLARALETTPADLMGWRKIDSRLSGREASDEIYRKFADNIERHHGKEKELLEVYRQLSDENKDKTIQYSKSLLSVQQMDSELLLNAAHHSRGDFTDEERQADEDMLD